MVDHADCPSVAQTAGLVSPCFSGIGRMGGCNFAGHGGIPFLMIPVFPTSGRFLCLGDGRRSNAAEAPDGRWGIIKINVINELPLFVSAGGSAPELMGAFSETTGHLFLQYGMPHKPERASPHHERKEWVL